MYKEAECDLWQIIWAGLVEFIPTNSLSAEFTKNMIQPLLSLILHNVSKIHDLLQPDLEDLMILIQQVFYPTMI